MVENQFRDYPETAAMCLLQKGSEVAQITVRRVDAGVVGDIVAVVFERRRIERKQPQGRDAEIPQIIELLGESAKVADAVAVGVEEGPDVKLVYDRVLVPTRVLGLRNFPIATHHAAPAAR